MEYSWGTVVSVTLLTTVLLSQDFLPGADARVQDPVITVESTSVTLTILIPNSDLAKSASYITLRHDTESQLGLTDVVFLMNNVSRIKDIYGDRLSVTRTGNSVALSLKNVSAADAGTYRCFSSSSNVVIPNCGQLLIVVRKPNPPTVKVLPLSGVLVGSDLHLVCETHSTSLPPSHRLTPEIFWYDHQGQNVHPSERDRRIHVNSESQLVIRSLRRTDQQLKFYCISADDTGGVVARMMSDPSDMFAVTPQYKPTAEDFRLSPVFESDDVMKRVIGQQVSYRCDADCQPPCDIMWLYKPFGGLAGIGEVTNLADKKVLSLDVSRINEGLYRCKAENRHGVINKTFYLEALYIGNPTTLVNEQEVSSLRLLEDSHVDLSCVFDSNPGPLVTWSSPSKGILSAQTATGPRERMASNGIYQRVYTSNQSLSHLRCEHTGVYTCDGRNNVSAGQGRILLTIMCPPSSAGVPGLELLPEYVWDIPHALTITFVIRALPEPDITRIFSVIRGHSRKEEIPRDFVISKSKMYEGKPHLTRFTLTSRRNLDLRDDGRVLAVTVESSEFTKEFLFTIRPRGIPGEVVNLTAWDVNHDSLMLSWTPGFNGGEVQTFLVELRVKGSSQWMLFISNIPDPAAGKWVTVQVGSLVSGTSYIVRVTAVNRLGSTSAEIEVTTLAAPDESLGSGAVAGIVLLALVIIAVIIVIIYCIVCRRRQQGDYSSDDEETETRKSMLPKQISNLLTWKTCRTAQDADDTWPSEDCWLGTWPRMSTVL
ncbi:unnamed protein product, partial [Candidula unifasciata]